MIDIEWPSLEDVSVSFEGAQYLVMSAEEFGIFARLAWCIASNATFGRYSNRVPDPSIPADRTMVLRLAGCNEEEWDRCSPMVMNYLRVDGDRLRLKDETMIRFSRRSARAAIPMAVKAAVLGRDGNRCSYCGEVRGPFHFDHLFPVSRGGTNEPSNIVVACAPCNLSKSDMTILEWVEAMRGRS